MKGDWMAALHSGIHKAKWYFIYIYTMYTTGKLLKD